jgi:outer membrane receptor protein involved in Fe transport
MKSLSPSVLATLLALGATALPAQQTKSNPGSTTDETVKLSAFEVSSSEVDGYATTSSTGASRIAVPITDLSTSVIAINEKLIADTLAVSAEDVLNLVGGVSAFAETQSQDMNKFSMRGYTSSVAQRDGFTDYLFGLNGGFKFTFIQRLEVLKGPNGILHGQNNPGGILNLVSKKPLPTPKTTVSLMGGSYDFYQADVDTSAYFDKDHHWGYRLSTSYSNTNGPLDHPADVNKKKGFFAINPVLSYKNNGWEVWAWGAFVRDKSPRLKRIVKGFKGPNGTGQFLLDIADHGSAHNVLTNGAQVTNDSYELGLTKGVNLGRNLRLDMRFIARDTDLLNTSTLVNATGGIDIYVDPAGNIIGSDGRTIDYSKVVNNVAGIYRSVAVQLTGTNTSYKSHTYASDFAFSFDAGPTKNRFLLFGTYDKLGQVAIPGYNGSTYSVSSLANLQKIGADVVGSTARIWLYPLDRETLAGVSPQTVIANANTISAQGTTVLNNKTYSGGGMERLSMWDDRIFAIAGARYTSIDSFTQTGVAAGANTSDTVWSESYGIVAKAYKGEKGQVSLFYNNNSTFIPVTTIDQRLATFGQKFPNRTVNIQEYGVKLDLLDSRVVSTASWYHTDENNVLLSETDVDGSVTGTTNRAYSVPAGRAKTLGWDIDTAVNLARGFNVVASYGLMHARLSDGHRTSGQPADTASVLARYEVQKGMFKNLSFLWQYTWWGDSMLNNRTYWKVPDGDLHTAVLGYHWKNYSLNLRCENVFDDIKVRPSLNETAVGVTNHRNFRLQLSGSF